MKRKLPAIFYILPGIPMAACPLCGHRPFFYCRRVKEAEVLCPVTHEKYTLRPHFQFSVGCQCNYYPFRWGFDIWNTAKAWTRGNAEWFGGGVLCEEQYTGKTYQEFPTFNEQELPDFLPPWAICTSPTNKAFQPVPKDLGPPGVFYPTHRWFTTGQNEAITASPLIGPHQLRKK